MSDSKIKCPNCGHTFDVEEALSGQLEAHYRAEFEKKTAEQANRFRAEREQFEKEQEAFREKKDRENEIFREKLAKELARESRKIEEKTREQFEVEMASLKEEVGKRKEENRELKEKEVDLMKRERQLEEKQEDLKLDMEKQMLEKQKEIEDRAREQEREAFVLKEREWAKKFEDQKKIAEELKRKAEQGSMQMQGEVQELALEELLASTYPFDRIEEVPKGVRGADCIQTVINPRQQECGSIVYESKRTKHFSPGWIEKLKQDQVQCKADIAVIVTETYPAGMVRFGEMDGVWICGFHEVTSLSFVLREMLIKTQSVRSAEENKGDKMELLYDYLTSNEFVQNIGRIVENYDGMIRQLNSEKKAMHKIWAAREKQIWVVQENISALFGSIKGIAGNELATSDVLELPENSVED
jgi:hypothetical protein